MSNIDAESQQDEVLLPGPPPNFQNLQLRRQSVRVTRESRQGLKGPLRAARLCLLSVLIPGMLVAIPLYMRFHVYGEQLYPVGMSDMRLLDNRVSTTWCQRQLVRANTTFNAFLLSEQPVVEPEPLRVSMSRQIELEDDMKEYWAFYLLQGSSVTVSTCVRWPGASLVVIRGHKHLHQCAYIGDDSSEELDELERHIEEGGQWPRVTVNDPNQIKMLHEQHSSTGMGTSDESNEPHRMRRVRPGILFHGNQQPLASDEQLHHKEDLEEDVDSIMLQLLQNIGRVKAKVKGKDVTNVEKKPVESQVTVVAESPRSVNVTKKIVKEELVEKEKESVTSSPPTSGEVFEDVLRRLQRLGDRGRGVLQRLNKQLGEATPIQVNETKQNVDLFALRQIIQEMIQSDKSKNNDSEKNTTGSGVSGLNTTESDVSGSNATENNATIAQERRKRSFTWSSANLEELTADEDEEENGAFEEEAQPDGHADHHAIVNETTPNDQSKSEFWSSFSSSEEKLLNCAGLILNLPLTPHSKCKRELSDDDYLSASHVNTLTYKIPRNGYYFFVFSSENEVQTNYIRVKFELEKRVYNVSNPMAACKNSTEQCSLPLDFFSSEKVVLELPVRSNDSLWNEEFIAVSTCEPRTALYLGCVIAVPLFILLFAFQ